MAPLFKSLPRSEFDRGIIINFLWESYGRKKNPLKKKILPKPF